MADNQHKEQLIFELVGAERAKQLLREVAEGEKKLAEAVKEARVESEKAAKVEKAREKGAASMRKAALGVAAAWAVVAVRVGEAVQAYARADAANGRLRFALQRVTGDAKSAEKAFQRAAATFRDWEKFGVSVEEQTDAFRDLVDATGNYEQSLNDIQTAHDLAAQANIEFSRAAEAVRKVRQGEVEVLKDIGVLTKDEAEALGKVEDASKRTARAMKALMDKVGGGAAGNQGLDASLKSTNVKLDTTKKLVGEIAAKVLEEGTGLVASFGEFIKVLDRGEHPLDEVNDRLTTLRNHVRDGDWKKLAGVLMLTNPATFTAGLVTLGIASSEGHANSAENERAGQDPNPTADPEFATNDAFFSSFGGADARGGRGGYGKGGVAKPEPKDPKKPRGRRDDGSGAAVVRGTPDDEVFGVIGDVLESDRDAAAIAENRERAAFQAKYEVWQDEQAAFIEHQERMNEIADEAATDRLEEQQKKEQDAIEKRNDALMAGADAAASLTQSFVKDEGAKAVVLGGIEVGKSIAAAASGNAAGAIGHGAAAVQFFAVAAQAGVGGGGKGKLRKGNRAGRTASATEDRERIGRIGGDVERQTRQSETLVINVNSAITPHPEQTRKLADELEREYRNRTGRQWGGR